MFGLSPLFAYISPEVGKVTLKSNGYEALNDDFVPKSNAMKR